MLTLKGREIKDLAEAVGLEIQQLDYTDELETEMTIIACPASGVTDDDDGKVRHYEHVAYLSEYPDDGTFPLGDQVPPACKHSCTRRRTTMSEREVNMLRTDVYSSNGIVRAPMCCGQKMADDGECSEGCCDDWKCEKCSRLLRTEAPD